MAAALRGVVSMKGESLRRAFSCICGFTCEFEGIGERGVHQENMDRSSLRGAGLDGGWFCCSCGLTCEF